MAASSENTAQTTDDERKTRGRGFLDPAALTRLGGLKLRATRVVEGVIAGLHRSPHKGSSVEFAEYKEYAPGDPIRHIDWKAYAKSDKYYVKQYEDETNLRAWLLLDASGSMDFASGEISKLDYARTLIASLAHLLLRQGDAPGLVCFDTDARPSSSLRPSGRSTQLDDIVHVLDDLAPGERPTSVVSVLESIAERVRKRSLVVLVSDMLDPNPDIGHMLGVLRSRGMDLVVIHILDPAEIELPWEGLSVFEGLETGDGELLVDPDDIRDAYRETFSAHLDGLERACQQAHTEYHRTVTSQPFEEVLLSMMQGRIRRAAKRR